MVIIKVTHKETARRFMLSPNASWIELEAKLRPLFSIPALSPFTLSYTDEDNDVITLSTDIELQEILSSGPTVKFNLKFSTPDDSSDSEDSGNEVWVLEGGTTKKTAPITKIETDTPDLQDNFPQKNIVSTTNQEPREPQFIEIDSHDIIEPSSSNKKIPVDDDLEKAEEKKHQANVLDDEFFKSFNSQINVNIRQISIEDKQESIEDKQESIEVEQESIHEQESIKDEQESIKDEEESDRDEQESDRDEQESVRDEQESVRDEQESIRDEQESIKDGQESGEDEQETIEASSLNNNLLLEPRRLRRDREVDLQQFQMMIELNQDAIKENPQLVASIKDIMDQIQRLHSFRQPNVTHKRNFNRSITPPIPVLTATAHHPLHVPEIFRSTTPPPIPGSFPKHPARSVPWATEPPEARNRGGRRGGRRHHFHHHQPHHHNYKRRDNRGDNREPREKKFDYKEEKEEETTDLRVVYGEKLDELKSMGFADENALVGLLVEHDGNMQEVLEKLLENNN